MHRIFGYFRLWQFGFMLLAIASADAQQFPQSAINKALDNRTTGHNHFVSDSLHRQQTDPSSPLSFLKSIPDKISSIHSRLSGGVFSSMTDTIFVGEVPADTLIITGNFFNNGPVLVFNDGVLIFENATATIMGDMYVFQNGKVLADSSLINCPQQYFYQRGIIIANNGYVEISNTTLDYGGLSHNLAVVDNGEIILNNIINVGFTTAGAYGNASITIDGSNQAGEFIMTDSSHLSFSNAATVLLWHHIPDGALVDVTFPNGASVAGYAFDNAQPGVSGIGYDVEVLNCTDVMWALMPENGSDVTISGSVLRAIGLWFTGTDTVTVSGLVNNSGYTAFTAPLTDRNLQLNTTSVQTWSLYLFDQTVMNVTGCIVGEVGSMGSSHITAQGIFCDGSGGYYWAADTSLNIAVNTTVLGYVRSQGNGILLLGYGSSTAGASAIGNSVLVVTQSSLPQDPVAYEHGVAWRVHINPPQNLFVDTLVNITGSAWVDQGPLGSFMDFGSYTVEFAPTGVPGWIPVEPLNIAEVHNNTLTQWDTHGLTPGNYLLRLKTFNNLGDSIDAVIQVTLLPSFLGESGNISGATNFNTSYVAASDEIFVECSLLKTENCFIHVSDVNGKTIYAGSHKSMAGDPVIRIPFHNQSSGTYFIKFNSSSLTESGKVVVIRQ